jgi:hypothetical protein
MRTQTDDDLKAIAEWLADRAKPRRHKYGAKATVLDGIRFASMREANRYAELKQLERAGQIWDLTLQPRFELHVRYAGSIGPAGHRPTLGAKPWSNPPVLPAEQTIGEYVADFAYATATGTVIEDAKGFKTPLYRWKKKHVEAEYGVRIVEC